MFHTRCHRKVGPDLRDGGAAARRGRSRPHDALPHPGRRAARAPARRGGARMRIRAAVLERTGGTLAVQDVELAPPRAGRGARPPRRERRLPLGPERDRRDGRDPVPGGARPRGGRGRRGARRGRHGRRGRRPRHALVGAVVRALRGVHPRPAAALPGGVAGDGRGRAPRRHDAALPRRRADPPLLAHLVVRRGVRRPRALVRRDPEGRPLRRRGARRLRGHDGRRAPCGTPRASGRATGSRSSAAAGSASPRSSARSRRARPRSSPWTSRRRSSASRASSERRRASSGRAPRRRRRTRSARRRVAASTTRSRRPGGRRR